MQSTTKLTRGLSARHIRFMALGQRLVQVFFMVQQKRLKRQALRF